MVGLTFGSGVLAQFCRLLSRPSVLPSLCFGSGASLNFLSLMALKSLSKVLSFQAKHSPTGGTLCPGAGLSVDWPCDISSGFWSPTTHVQYRNTYTSFRFFKAVALEVDRFEIFSVRWWGRKVSWCPSWWKILEWSRVIAGCDVLRAWPLRWNNLICSIL